MEASEGAGGGCGVVVRWHSSVTLPGLLGLASARCAGCPVLDTAPLRCAPEREGLEGGAALPFSLLFI